MNDVWIANDKFHGLCIEIWTNGMYGSDIAAAFNYENILYNEDWFNMFMELLDEDYVNYCNRNEVTHIDSNALFEWENAV